MSVNSWHGIGNLGADPKVRDVNGKSVADFRMACSEKWKDANGQPQERTEWVSVTVWGKQAESVGRYLTKGRSVYVEGRLQTRKWQDKDGADRYTTEVVARDVRFLGGGKGDGKPAAAANNAASDDDFEF